jgi:hypothetical protein
MRYWDTSALLKLYESEADLPPPSCTKPTNSLLLM